MQKRIFGITGVPASGKTTVAHLLVKKGMDLVDVDKAGKWAVEKNSGVQQKLKKVFGEDLFENGVLQRKKLGAHVFAEKSGLEKLNNIIHPVMLQRVDSLINDFRTLSSLPFILIDAALLFELELYKKCDKTIVVWSDIERCIQRSLKRDGLTRMQAEQRIKSQMPQEAKKKRADILLENNGPFRLLNVKVDDVFKALLSS
jgi:dephospho-CoA kinase